MSAKHQNLKECQQNIKILKNVSKHQNLKECSSLRWCNFLSTPTVVMKAGLVKRFFLLHFKIV
jgi:hypothetical protein